MFLRHASLKSWGPLRWPLVLEFRPGLNVVYGKNEIGKSTIVRAIRSALFERPQSEIERLRPWGTKVTPEIELLFEAEGHAWKLQRSFTPNGNTASLHKAVESIWYPVADSPDFVQAELTRLVARVEPRRTRSSEELRAEAEGVYRILWTHQAYDPLDKLVLTGSVQQDLSNAVTASLISLRDHRLFRQCQQRLAEYYTEGRGMETGSLREARERLQRAESSLENLQKRRTELESRQARVSKRLPRLDEQRAILAELREQFEAVQEEYRQAKTQSEQETLAEERMTRADKDWKQAEDNYNELQDLHRERDTQLELKAAVDQLLAQARAADESLAEMFSERQEDLQECETAESRADMAVREWSSIQAYVELRDQASDWESCLLRADQLEAEFTRLEANLKEIKLPTDTTFQQLSALRSAIQADETQLATLTSLHLVVEVSSPVSVVIGEGEQQHELKPAEPNVIFMDLNKPLVVPGVATLTLQNSNGDSPQSIRARLESLRQELLDGLRGYNVQTLDELHERRDTYKQLSTQSYAVQLRLSRELRGRTREEVLVEIGALRQRLQSMAVEHLPGNPQTIRKADVGARVLAARAEYDRARAKSATIRSELEKLHQRIGETQRNVVEFTSRQREVDNRIVDLDYRIRKVQEPFKSDADQLANLAVLEQEYYSLREKWREITRATRGLEDIEQQYLELKEKIEDIEFDVQELQSDIDQERGLIKSETSDGLFSRLADAETELELARDSFIQIKGRADALSLLVPLFERQMEKVSTSLVEPVSAKANQLWTRVVGEAVRPIRMQALRPQSLSIDGVDAPTDYLSAGAREQLGIVVRLALADVVTSGANIGRQTMLLDEPLVYSDPERRRNVVRLFAELGQHVQIIVFAQNPTDYTDASAHLIDLENLVAASRQNYSVQPL